MNPLVVTNGDDTYVLVNVDPGLPSSQVEPLITAWHSMFDYNDRVKIKLMYIRHMDDRPIEITG